LNPPQQQLLQQAPPRQPSDAWQEDESSVQDEGVLCVQIGSTFVPAAEYWKKEGENGRPIFAFDETLCVWVDGVFVPATDTKNSEASKLNK